MAQGVHDGEVPLDGHGEREVDAADAARVADAEADGQNDGVDGALVPHRYGREAKDGLARQQIDDVEDGEVDEEHVERRPHPRPMGNFY